MFETTSQLALNTATYQNASPPTQLHTIRGIPSYLYPGDKYNIRMGLASVKKDILNFNFDNPPIEPEVVERALHDYMKNIDASSLSAYQLGFDFKAMIIRAHDNKFNVYFNPLIVHTSAEFAVTEEVDPSFPSVVVKIKRPYSIRARVRNGLGQVSTITLDGALSRFFQHEYDRIQGNIFWMNADTLHRNRAVRDWKQSERKLRTWVKTLARD